MFAYAGTFLRCQASERNRKQQALRDIGNLKYLQRIFRLAGIPEDGKRYSENDIQENRGILENKRGGMDMSEMSRRVSSGQKGLDEAIDQFRLGDNVVWQVDTMENYRYVVEPYVKQARADGRNIIYIRFGLHRPVIRDLNGISVYEVSPQGGFEDFATRIHNIIKKEGLKAFYVFDCLTDLLKFWYSDLMIGNFFMVTCPYLFQLDTVAYFALRRNVHTYDTIARIRETTQVLLDLYEVDDDYYIHPLKVWQRYSPTMFLPHKMTENGCVSITSSAETAELLSNLVFGSERMDYWNQTMNRARETLATGDAQEREEAKQLLVSLLVGRHTKMYDMCMQYFRLEDLLKIAAREIGSGYIGGKSVGMLLARRILTRGQEYRDYFQPFMESHDSYYLGSDVFYTYIVQNGLWSLRMKQKTEEGYFVYADELREKLLVGKFHETIEKQFIHMLEYFGQSPIIVRSSSLQEDSFGNAFAGKYESVFCVNQGTPEERLENFEQAVRTVYASMMNMDALHYRKNRGLAWEDEQMAILIQRVSGDYYGDYFFPHAAGVGNSSNLYVYDQDVDMDAGMLRLVFGLGTRAVDRVIGDYVKIVTLDDPLRRPLMSCEDEVKFSQHKVDVLNLAQNCMDCIDLDDAMKLDIKTKKLLFGRKDPETARRLREMGRDDSAAPFVLDFRKILSDTRFPEVMKRVMSVLSEKYHYPVDIEFTANFQPDGSFKFNLLQCRPLQTRGLGKTVELPEKIDRENCLFYSKGNFMGGNVRLPIQYVVLVKTLPYLTLPDREKYTVARQVGMLNEKLKGKNAMLIGPGRWGTTTPSLGVPVNFTELCNMSAMCELSYSERGVTPELSYGSHFFQDIVESGIFYTALFRERETVTYHEEYLTRRENLIEQLLPEEKGAQEYIGVYETPGLQVYSDITRQIVLCSFCVL